MRRLFGRGKPTTDPTIEATGSIVGPRRKKLGRWLRRETGKFFHHDKDKETAVGSGDLTSPKTASAAPGAVAEVDPGSDGETPFGADEAWMETDEDLRFCPACIDAIDHRKEGKRRTLFAFPWSPPAHDWADVATTTSALSTSPAASKGGSQLLGAVSLHSTGISVLSPIDGENASPFIIKLRSHSDFVRTFPVAKLSKLSSKAKRLTGVERERRQLAEIYSLMLSKVVSYSSVMDAFFGAPSECDRLFLSLSLSKGAGGSSMPKKSPSDEFWEGSVAFATDKRHWVEGVAFLSHGELMLCKSADTRKVILSIPTHSIICIRAMQPEQVPMDMFGFFQVETFSRVMYFMVRSERQRDGWLSAFSTVGLTSVPNYSEMSLSKLVEDLYFGVSTAWSLDKKRLFNYRNIIFRRTGLSPEFHGISVAQLAEGIYASLEI